MIVTNGQENIDIISVVDARDDESLVRFLKSRSLRAGIACKHAAVVSNRLFEDFYGVTATAYTSKQHIHTFRALVSMGSTGRRQICAQNRKPLSHNVMIFPNNTDQSPLRRTFVRTCAVMATVKPNPS